MGNENRNAKKPNMEGKHKHSDSHIVPLGNGWSVPGFAARISSTNDSLTASPTGGMVFAGFTSRITMNSNPASFFMRPGFVSLTMTGNGTGYPDETFQAIEVLHELGHGSANFNVPSSIVPDANSAATSISNTQALANGCFPQGDFGGNSGPLAPTNGPVSAVRRRLKF